MKFKELKKSLSVEISPVYLVSGEDAFFRERALKLICERCVKEPDINLTVYNGADVKEDPEKLLSALFSFPFMSEKRVVAVREYYPTSANFAPLRPYFEDPQETTVFVVVNSASCDVLSKQKGITPVDCSKGDLSLLGGWVSNEAAKAGLAITPRAAANLIDLCDYDMTRINGETEKLISYAADKGEITEDDVSEICVKETDYELFDAVGYIADKNFDKAYASLTEAMRSSGDAQRLFSTLYGHFRRLLYVSVTGVAMSAADMAKALKVKEGAIRIALSQSKKFSQRRLRAIVDKLGKAESSYKSGVVLADDAVLNGIFGILVE